ncbi:Uncharacterized [Syntrophomonas zehnderi OL-4]|uniref:Uncharacterized n=1 Tax=Syntrophomonas zehnderi OL-4 TaxID=690567 RepID=A0A0E4C7D5_9FIRM|nr:hypothetical protein [Syntrophomonas zehnderi]CFW97582.1 Uncharacterized [Syntrophomonas zehnderi OL-4]
MNRNRSLWLIPLATLVVFLAAYLIYEVNRPQPAKKPAPTQEFPQGESKWYIQFSVKQQKATAYTEATSAPVSSAGKKYFIGSGAVHPRYPLNAGGEARSPIIPFGTIIYLSKPIEIAGQKHNSLVINDTGDVYYGLWPAHPYWVDIYHGSTNRYSVKSADQAGIRLIDYTWFEPWPEQ